MAKAKTPQESIAISSRQAAKDAKSTFEDLNRQRSESKNLLLPEAIADEVNAATLLYTTLGGQLRPITYDDLKQFKYKVALAKDKYKKGIKPKDVINLSLQDDIDRANREIRTAIPLNTKGGEIKFTTNAGVNSKKTRHYVTVNMLNFNAAVASPLEPAKIVSQVIKGAVTFTCDCERWRYWYAYMATVGGYNAGYKEAAYPKIRNPDMIGVACKHILRVMTQMQQSPTLKQFVTNIIQRERNAVENRRKALTLKQMKELEQQAAKESSRQRKVETAAEKKRKREAMPSYQKRLQQQVSKAEQREREKSIKAAAIEAAKKGIDSELMKLKRQLLAAKLPDVAIQAAIEGARKALEKELKAMK